MTITINDKAYKVEAGQTIMQAADECGYHIPRLCYHPKLSIEGACRVCIVEVEGMQELRRLVLLSRRRRDEDTHRHQGDPHRPAATSSNCCWTTIPMDCHTCERDSNCELQRLAYVDRHASPAFRGRAQAL